MFASPRRAARVQSVRIEALEGRQLLSAQPWAFFAHLIGQDAVAQAYPALTGRGETVVSIDSGVDYNHPVLGGGFGPGHKVEAGWDFASNDPNPFCDTFAHGTAGAGIMAGNHYVFGGTQNQGIVPDANIIALRVGSQVGIRSAMDWVIANRTRYNIVAVNFTDFGGAPFANYNGEISTLYNSGVFVTTPAGNGGPGQYVYGANESFTVGGIGHNDHLTSFSARGPNLDMVAPADGVTVPYYDVVHHKSIVTDAGQGTSWAAPYVAGAAAMIKEINPRFSVGQIQAILKDSGHNVYDSVSNRNYKRLDLLAAVKLAYSRAGVATAHRVAPAPSRPAAPVPARPVTPPPASPAPRPGAVPAPARPTPFSTKPITAAAKPATPKASPAAPATQPAVKVPHLARRYTGTRSTSLGVTDSFRLTILRQRAGRLTGQFAAGGHTFAVTGQVSANGTFAVTFTDEAGQPNYLGGSIGKGGKRLTGQYVQHSGGRTVAWGTFGARRTA